MAGVHLQYFSWRHKRDVCCYIHSNHSPLFPARKDDFMAPSNILVDRNATLACIFMTSSPERPTSSIKTYIYIYPPSSFSRRWLFSLSLFTTLLYSSVSRCCSFVFKISILFFRLLSRLFVLREFLIQNTFIYINNVYFFILAPLIPGNLIFRCFNTLSVNQTGWALPARLAMTAGWWVHFQGPDVYLTSVMCLSC